MAWNAQLDETLLDAACDLFAVRREWLDGAETRVYPDHDFYKREEDVADFIENLKAKNPEGDLKGVLIAPEEGNGEALVLLEEMIGCIGEKPIYRYHLCNNWRFEYWKSRAYLTAFIAIAWKQEVHIRGVFLPSKDILPIVHGETLLDAREDGGWQYGGLKWYPEDMALKPSDFLHAVDPEEDNFGAISGLRLWLSLEEKGYMDTGIKTYNAGAVRRQFQDKLDSYLALA